MQNYYNRQLEFDNYERAEFLNYLKRTGKIDSNFHPVSNYNSDFLTDKIGQEYNAIKTPQTYFSRKFQGTLKPIDNNLNYYDFYSLGKGGLPYGEYNKNRFYNQKLFTPSALKKYNNINLPSKYINNKEYNNNMNNYNMDLNYGNNNNFNYNENNNNNNNNNYNNNNVNLRYNSENNFSNQNNFNEEKIRLPISKSMNNIDFQDYKRRLNEREKQLIGNYEDSHKYVETVPNYNNNYIYESNTKHYYPSNTYYNDDCINSNYPKTNRFFEQREHPCKI